MSYLPQVKVAATYMRGGTSKGVFFKLEDLPTACQQAGPERDKLLLRVIGSPDPYAKHTDGMGGATSSTSKTVIVGMSSKQEHDVDYLFGQVSIDKPFIDWSGNCGNLTAAVGSFAISSGMIPPERIPQNGVCVVRIWQQNISKTIIAHVPICNGGVQETGDFMLDGVTFPAAEVPIDFVNPAAGDSDLLPSGNVTDELILPTGLIESGSLTVTMISAGIPTIFVNAIDLGLCGDELQEQINSDEALLAKLEKIRAHGALKMGLINNIEQARDRQHTPKLAFVSPPSRYVSASGVTIEKESIDLQVRAMSMGKLHHAMMGTAAVSIASAAAVPGTLVNLALNNSKTNSTVAVVSSEGDTFENNQVITFGHPSGTLKVAASVSCKVIEQQEKWHVAKVTMSRSARTLMEGWVKVPQY